MLQPPAPVSRPAARSEARSGASAVSGAGQAVAAPIPVSRNRLMRTTASRSRLLAARPISCAKVRYRTCRTSAATRTRRVIRPWRQTPMRKRFVVGHVVAVAVPSPLKNAGTANVSTLAPLACRARADPVSADTCRACHVRRSATFPGLVGMAGRMAVIVRRESRSSCAIAVPSVINAARRSGPTAASIMATSCSYLG